MTDIRQWLEALGLGKYAATFAENDVDFRALSALTEDDLKELGLSLGHRRILQQALARPGEEAPPSARPASHAPAAVGARARDAERRQLTVMFCDLVGSTELSQRLDAEDLREVITAYQSACKKAIDRYEGYIARYMGDGVLVYFGYPQAHEDDAERAIHSGLEVVRTVGRLDVSAAFSVKCEARVGIATGPVVVGDLIGEGASQESAVVGETPNLAARLQAEAEPGSVVVSGLTHRLAGGVFEYAGLGQRRLKGIASPVELWRAAAEHSQSSRFQARHSARLEPMIGREEELELLARRWRQATEREGQLALVVGEPGIGKSRLVEALRARLSQERHVWLDYQCSPHHVSSPFHPLIAQLRRAAALEAGADPLTRLVNLLARTSGRPEQDAPLFAALMSIPVDDRFPAIEMDPRERKARTVEALTRQFEGLAREAPVLCVFEDAHWMDPSTIEVVDRLLQNLDATAALIVVTHRPEFNASWARQPYTTLVTLNRMGRADSRRLVEAGASLPDSLIDEITRRADGVPLFLEELAQSVAQPTDRLPAMSVAADGDRHSHVPETLQDSLRARLDRVPAAARDLAELAAVIGRDFDYALLEGASGMSADEVAASTAQLVKAGLVQLRGAEPETMGRFKHALLRDAAYASLTRGRRRAHHASVARAMTGSEHRPSAAGEPEVVATHLAGADLPNEALPYWLEATTRASGRFAHREAIELARSGLALVPGYPVGLERDRLELELQFALGISLRSLRGMVAEETRAAFDRAAALGRQLGHPDRELESLRGIYNFYFVRGQIRDARRVGEVAAAVAERTGDPHHAASAYSVHGSSFLYAGSPGEAGAWYAKALAHSVESKDSGTATDTVIRVLDNNTAVRMNSAWACWLLGYPDKAAAWAGEAIEVARGTNDPFPLAVALVWSGGMATCLGRLAESADQVRELVSITSEHEILVWTQRGHFLEGKLDCLTQRRASGLRTMLRALDELRELDARQAWTWLLAESAQECLREGLFAEALDLLEEASAHAERNDERYWLPEIHRVRGLAQLQTGTADAKDAEGSLRTALELAMSQESPSLALRAATSLAGLLKDRGQCQAAHELLAPVYEAFTEGFATSDLVAARTLLAQLD